MFLKKQVLLGLLQQFLTEIVCSLNVSFTLLALRVFLKHINYE